MLQRFFLRALIFLLVSLWYTGAAAQFFYRDIWNTQQLIKEMAILKSEKIRTISIKSFDNSGEPEEGFFCEKRFDKNYNVSQTVTRSHVTDQSLLSSYFNSKGLIIKTSDSTETALNVTEYFYNENDKVIAVKTLTKSNNDVNAIEESRDYIYDSTGHLQKIIRKKNGLEVSVINFKLDEKGNVLEEEEVSKNGRGKKYFYYYDDKNNLTDVVSYNERAKRLLPDYMYEYNSAGQIKQMITTETSGGYYIWRYTYNDKKLRETERCLSKEKKLLGSVQYSYK
jgi:hypothetical protein